MGGRRLRRNWYEGRGEDSAVLGKGMPCKLFILKLLLFFLAGQKYGALSNDAGGKMATGAAGSRRRWQGASGCRRCGMMLGEKMAGART